jgi:hypothetical protein
MRTSANKPFVLSCFILLAGASLCRLPDEAFCQAGGRPPFNAPSGLADGGTGTILPPAPMPPSPAASVPSPSNHDEIPVPDALAVPASPPVYGQDGTAPPSSSPAPQPSSLAPLVAAPCGHLTKAPRDCPPQSYCHASCYGIRPLGQCAAAAVCAQVGNGIAAQMVLYNYDFNDPAIGDPAKLSFYGMRRVNEIARMLRCGNCNVVTIEQMPGSPALDTARQMQVIAAFGEAGLAPQVAVGDTDTGMLGAEALLAHGTRLQQFAAGGPGFKGQSSGSSGASGNGGGSSSSGQGSSQ